MIAAESTAILPLGVSNPIAFVDGDPASFADRLAIAPICVVIGEGSRDGKFEVRD